MSDLTLAEYAAVTGFNAQYLASVLRKDRDALPVTPYRVTEPRGAWRFPAAEVARVHGSR